MMDPGEGWRGLFFKGYVYSSMRFHSLLPIELFPTGESISSRASHAPTWIWLLVFCSFKPARSLKVLNSISKNLMNRVSQHTRGVSSETNRMDYVRTSSVVHHESSQRNGDDINRKPEEWNLHVSSVSRFNSFFNITSCSKDDTLSEMLVIHRAAHLDSPRVCRILVHPTSQFKLHPKRMM